MKRLKRLCIGVAIGLALLAGIIWLLSQTLGEREALYDGKPVGFWIEQSKTFNLALSNQANLVLTLQIIPQLTEIIYHDTNDSKLRMELIEA
ncbi:MAG: domain containing protein [Pedosphaera sp.]|nr:domain containing protein [Pedosphaera sp.]